MHFFLPFCSSWGKDVVFHSAIIIGLAAAMDSGLLLPGYPSLLWPVEYTIFGRACSQRVVLLIPVTSFILRVCKFKALDILYIYMYI